MIETVTHLIPKSYSVRKKLGQYFTNQSVAGYMADMIQPVNAPIIRILDAGAGTGILTVFASLRCLKLGHKRVHAVLYEIDTDIIAQLAMSMNYIAQVFNRQNGKFTFEIYNKDFVLSRPDKTLKKFHISSINPPYFKYNSKTSSYANATGDLYKGNPNIYASFMAITANCLTLNGQMTAIVPRSFTNGLYFKGFRQYMNRNLSLEQVHVFRARDKVFKESSVLQENVICRYIKRNQNPSIKISVSIGYEDLKQTKTTSYSTGQIIDSLTDHEIIRIPETPEDIKILQTVSQWSSSFRKNGYFISTGPIVEYRSSNHITYMNQKNRTIPLLKMHNVKSSGIQWTGHNKKDVFFRLFEGHEKYTLKNEVYVILKRFSSKDEKRRLIAAVHNPQIIKGRLIAMENHINYIGRSDGPLELSEAHGLAVFFNSTLMDKYFRCLSGNTQINATEVKLLKMPPREVICQMGESFPENSAMNQHNIDSIINFYLEKTIA